MITLGWIVPEFVSDFVQKLNLSTIPYNPKQYQCQPYDIGK